MTHDNSSMITLAWHTSARAATLLTHDTRVLPVTNDTRALPVPRSWPKQMTLTTRQGLQTQSLHQDIPHALILSNVYVTRIRVPFGFVDRVTWIIKQPNKFQLYSRNLNCIFFICGVMIRRDTYEIFLNTKFVFQVTSCCRHGDGDIV